MNTVIKIVTGSPTVRKASSALAAGFLGSLGACLADGNLTGGEFLVSLGAGCVASAAVWKTDNKVA